MTKAEEKSIAYQLATKGPRVMGGSAILDEDEYKFWNINYDFKAGYEQAEKDLARWIPVTEALPEIDEEVIVLTNRVRDIELESANRICFAHIVDKNLAEDWDGWNIPGVKFWMPCPKIPREEK